MKKRVPLHIYRTLHRSGVEIRIGRKRYDISYPGDMWQQFPQVYRQTFADTLAYCFTMHLLLMDAPKLIYHFPPPPTEPFFFKGMLYSLPETAITEKEKTSTGKLLQLWYNAHFQTQFIGRPRYARFKNVNRNSKKRAIIPFSFGKDSLLTFALTRELGINPHPVFFREPRSPYENKHKVRLSERFLEEYGIEIDFFPVTAGWLRQTTDFYWGWDLLLTQYTLLLIPYLFGMRARYLFWAHEQSCNDTITDAQGFIINPVYEQSAHWLLVSNAMAKLVGCNSIFASLIEPIHEIAVMKILHTRFPQIGKYQMSCFGDEETSKTRRWCGQCSKCARMYIFLVGLGIAPRRVGFIQSMLGEEKRNLFSIFPDRAAPRDSSYSQSNTARDEQLLAFLLAWRRGVKGPLMQEFVRKHLAETRAREGELRKTFFGIHTSDSIPYELKKPLMTIFKEELAPLS